MSMDKTTMPDDQFAALSRNLDEPPMVIPEIVAFAEQPRSFVRKSVRFVKPTDKHH